MITKCDAHFYIYLRLRFGLVNSINTYYKLNICVVGRGDFSLDY